MFDEVESVPLWKMLREIRVRFESPAAQTDLSDLTATTLEGTVEDMWQLGDLQRFPDPNSPGLYTYRRGSKEETREAIGEVLWWYEHLILTLHELTGGGEQ
jgi:hypothetical protein